MLLYNIMCYAFVDTKPLAGTVLLMFYSVARDGVFSTASTDLIIGCVRTMAVSQKKVFFKPFILYYL